MRKSSGSRVYRHLSCVAVGTSTGSSHAGFPPTLHGKWCLRIDATASRRSAGSLGRGSTKPMFHSRSPPSDSSSELYAFSSPLSSSSSSSPTTSSPVDFEACSTSSKCCAAAAAETSPAAASSADIAIGGGGTGSPPRERTRPHGRAEKARNLRAARASRERQRGAPEWFGRRGVGAFSRLRKPSKLPGVRHVRCHERMQAFHKRQR